MPPKPTRSNNVAAPTANGIAANSTHGLEGDALVQYANAARISQSISAAARPSSAVDRTIASEGTNIILEALSKIQTTVTDIAVRQEDIFRRLNDLEGRKASETSKDNTTPVVGNGRDRQTTANGTTSAIGREPLAWISNGKGTKRKADDLRHNDGKRARAVEAPTGHFNDDVSILGGGRGPSSKAEIAHAFRMASLFDENQRLQRLGDEQGQADEAREYPDSGQLLDPFSRSTVLAPNEPRIVSEVRANFMPEFWLADIS